MIKNFNEFINENTSSTGGPVVGGMGAVVSSQPSSLSGTTINPSYSDGGGTIGSDISIPYNASSRNKIFQKLKSPGFNHGSRDAKKERRKKSLKYLKNIFSKKQDYTSGQDKPGKVMNYNNFAKDDMMTIKKESLTSTIGALGLAASSLLKPTMPKEIISKDPIKDTTSLVEQTKDDDIKEFVDTIIHKYPNIVTDVVLGENTLSISVLENEFIMFKENRNLPDLSLKDLNILSKPQFPLHINYFVVRGLDTYDSPILIPILNLNYTNAVKIHGHDIEFNFTRMTGVNTIGAKINF